MGVSYYYRSGQRIPVLLSEGACAVRVSDERSAIAVQGWHARPLTSRFALLIRNDVSSVERAPADLRSLSRLIAENAQTLALDEPRATALETAAIDGPKSRPDLVTFPVAVPQAGGGMLIPTGDVVVQFPSTVTVAEVERIASTRKWIVVKSLSFVANGYVLRASTSDDPFAFANDLIEHNGALIAHPIFLEEIPNRSASAVAFHTGRNVGSGVSPALYAQQWHLANTGHGGGVPGQDIAAEAAHRITAGSSNITVCVVDSGVNASHECFQSPGKIVAGYDFQGKDADPSPAESSHGTSCSALAVASTGQILGVAPNCRLLPIRRTGLGDHLALAEAFVWAADHDADVISCSWGIDGQPWVLPDVVRSALVYVTTHGRRGKGAPIFWAAGNGGELISFDEWASSKYVIAVAASTDQIQKASYSDFGPEVSICAPSSGGTRGITTAANTGYTFLFGGTSAAAPIAAGVGALVLSVAPSLKWHEVRDLLQQSARKIDPGGAAYDHAGHSNFYGYGQVDALQALQQLPALLEAERVTDTVLLDSQIRNFAAWIQRSTGGSTILAWICARRFEILSLLQSSSAFRDAIDRLLRIIANLNSQLVAGSEVTVPGQAWPPIQLVLQYMVPRAISTSVENTERSVAINKQEVHMATNPNSLEDALNRIATMLGNPQSPAGALTPTTTVPPTPPVGGSSGAGSAPQSLSLQSAPNVLTVEQRQAISNQIYYSLQVPLITQQALLKMEQDLPDLINYLRSLPSLPAARAQLTSLINVITQSGQRSERSDGDQQRLAALGQAISRDAFGGTRTEERVAPLALALFMAAYTIVKNYKA